MINNYSCLAELHRKGGITAHTTWNTTWNNSLFLVPVPPRRQVGSAPYDRHLAFCEPSAPKCTTSACVFDPPRLEIPPPTALQQSNAPRPKPARPRLDRAGKEKTSRNYTATAYSTAAVMSRKPVTGGSTVVRLPTGPTTSLPSDICPVCKRVRYLNTDMEFLINPECYHPMCSNCVSNIFKSGPAQCPYATCTKTLRQRGFRSAFFGDLAVEREVDIRKRVAAAYNMVEDDFETLRDYNNYLQDVEDLTFDLISGGDDERAAAEQKLLRREQEFREKIERNKRRGREAELSRQKRDAAEAEAARQRRADEQREEARARAEEATTNAEVMSALARGEPGSAAEIQARIVAQKRARVAAISGVHFPSLLEAAGGTGAGNNTLSIRGLKTKKISEEEEDLSKPYDPFAGLGPALEPTRYELHALYPNPWLDAARTNDDHRTPGYNVSEYVARAMFDAFAGLGINIADEKKDASRSLGTVAAAEVSGASRSLGRADADDVFG
ncbi:putative CDK-activating kinase assembly factor MAT1 [Rosellinia necatrix]|uniref:RNA polymerase II transcription factor B subunit 3 n=1 Tax=Rosellinia necatrix TaxID=77044 RepID=A0A1S7ULX6_ROSNE|nr:putative CDK-activating kinase assembly factor MAT1 [Rosellinia necatrix]